MITDQMLNGVYLGVTAASTVLAIVVLCYSGARAIWLACNLRFRLNDVICQVSVLVAAGILFYIVRRVWLVLNKSPIVADAPVWSTLAATGGAACMTTALSLCLIFQAERTKRGLGRIVGMCLTVVVGASILGGALSS